MINGLWTVEFISTLSRIGKGIIVFNNNRLLGGDSGYYYSGSYRIDDNRIEGDVDVTRFDINSFSVFGDIPNFSLRFQGEVSKNSIDGEAYLVKDLNIKIRIICSKKEDL